MENNSDQLDQLQRRVEELEQSIFETQLKRAEDESFHELKKTEIENNATILETNVLNAANNMIEEKQSNLELERIKRRFKELARPNVSKQEILVSQAKDQIRDVAKFIDDSKILEPGEKNLMLDAPFLEQLDAYANLLERIQLSDPAISTELNNLIEKVDRISKLKVFNSVAQLYLDANKKIDKELGKMSK